MNNIRAGFILLAAIWPATAQVWDNTGNKLLNGAYYFREVTFTSNDSYSFYGSISFSSGTYSINAQGFQSSTGGQAPYTPNGTYSLAASGFGFISNDFIGSPIYGSVGANGVFVGSATEGGVSDIFIAAPLTSQNTGTLQGAYSIAYADPTGALAGGTPFGALLEMTSNGAGTIATANLSAYASSTTPTTQSISGVKYFVSSNAFVVTFPNSSSNLIQGQEYLYSTPDGSFVFGGAPDNVDMLVGVRTGTSGTFGGIYYTAGFQIDESQAAITGQIGVNTSYGSFNANNGAILGHQRIQNGGAAFGYTYADSYPASSGGSYTDKLFPIQFIGGNGAAAQIGIGIGPYPGISVAVRAPSFTGSGVYLNPQGVVNAASFAPFTAGISRGDFIILQGSNLGPGTLLHASTVPLPTTLGNVKVLINSVAAPISYVSSTQLAVIVPVEITASVAEIQVINDGKASNVVTEFVNATTPGVFSQTQNGFGYAAALRPNGSLVTPSNPTKAGETIAVFVAGLGDVFPTLLDGVAAPSSPLSKASNAIAANVGGTPATVSYAGLAPGFVGLYQVNVEIPTGVTAGDNFLGISGPDSHNTEALISVIGPTSAAVPGFHPRAWMHPRTVLRRLPIAKEPARVPPPE